MPVPHFWNGSCSTCLLGCLLEGTTAPYPWAVLFLHWWPRFRLLPRVDAGPKPGPPQVITEMGWQSCLSAVAGPDSGGAACDRGSGERQQRQRQAGAECGNKSQCGSETGRNDWGSGCLGLWWLSIPRLNSHTKPNCSQVRQSILVNFLFLFYFKVNFLQVEIKITIPL